MQCSDRHDDDLALARRVAQGDREAFVTCFERHFDAVFAFALRRTGGEAAAERLTEEILRAALGALDAYAGDAPLAAWVLAIAHSTAGVPANPRREAAHP